MRKIWIIIALTLILTGCKSAFDIKPDTIVDIPLHPTEEATTEQTEPDTVPEETESLPTETEPPTEESTKPPSSGKTPDAQPPTDPPTEPPTDPPTQPAVYDPSGYVPGSLDRAVADTINTRRQEAGLDTLRFDKRLCAIASVRAREVSTLWSQSRPDGSPGISVLREYGYSYARAGENLYYGAGSAATIVDKWMSAEARRANILMEAATAIGVGSYTSPDGLTYVSVLIAG